MDNYYFHMDNLSVGYDKKALIHDICIGIKKGEIVTLIGPNGSGKSTILKSITRQLQIIGGKVYFDDRNLNSFSYLNISLAKSSILMSAISASALAAILSCWVQVGERNIKVSEIMAAQRSPAILGGISSRCSS